MTFNNSNYVDDVFFSFFTFLFSFILNNLILRKIARRFEYYVYFSRTRFSSIISKISQFSSNFFFQLFSQSVSTINIFFLSNHDNYSFKKQISFILSNEKNCSFIHSSSKINQNRMLKTSIENEHFAKKKRIDWQLFESYKARISLKKENFHDINLHSNLIFFFHHTINRSNKCNFSQQHILIFCIIYCMLVWTFKCINIKFK